jgi:hypothetical protein
VGGYQHRAPITFTLYNKRGKYGLRAIGTTPTGQKLRSFWRQATIPTPTTPPTTTLTTTTTTPVTKNRYLSLSYDDAIRTKLFIMEIEIQLPPCRRSTRSSSSKALPSVIYQIPMESGNMNPKNMIPRGTAQVLLYPYGRNNANKNANAVTSTTASSSSLSTTTTMKEKPIPFGTCRIGMGLPAIRPGLVDPAWSKGKPIFRTGHCRSVGTMS